MNNPTVDIIVPVWNNLFETRACLAAILEHSPEARLIIVDNGSSRETELMLEEFSDPLGDHGLFIKSERNVGLVPAINMGLARSDSDYAVVLRPHVTVTAGWLTTLLAVAAESGAGIVSPQFFGAGAPDLPRMAKGCTQMETCTVSFAALLLKGEMRMVMGGFDEGLDGGEWCLREYVRRVADTGHRAVITSRVQLACAAEAQFGSDERRKEALRQSQLAYTSRWGVARRYMVYFGKECLAADLGDTMETILQGARRGNRYTLLMHARQAGAFRRMGWNGLHTGIELYGLAPILSGKSLKRAVARLQLAYPDIVAVRGRDGISFPGVDTALPPLALTVCSEQELR